MEINQIITLLTVLTSATVAITISVYSLKKTAEMQITLREMEAEKDERIQRKKMEHEVMLRSLETLQKSFYFLRRVIIATSYVGKDEESIVEQYKVIQEATEYWENNYCILPKLIREKFILVTNLASTCLNQELRKEGISMKTGEEISKMFEDIKLLTNEIVDELNPLSRPL